MVIQIRSKFAIYSGIAAALGSFFGKLPSIMHHHFEFLSTSYYAAVVICWVLMFISNGMVWTFFVKSLQELSSLTATATSTGVNYVVSALLGWTMFGEINPLSYWFGVSIVILGLAIVNSDREDLKVENEQREKVD